jgi:hypothetical protein
VDPNEKAVPNAFASFTFGFGAPGFRGSGVQGFRGSGSGVRGRGRLEFVCFVYLQYFAVICANELSEKWARLRGTLLDQRCGSSDSIPATREIPIALIE